MVKSNDIKVSIICCTYNHENYISDAIIGFLSQITTFDYEILIHDDASTDNTVEVIRKYQIIYPDKIKLIAEKTNQYSKNIRITSQIMIPIAKGKFISLCEGDDFWTDKYKLQKQFDALNSHEECDICAAACRVVNKKGDILKFIMPSLTDRIFSVDDVILGDGGFVATNTLFFRKRIFDNTFNFYKVKSSDYSLQILGSLNGGLYFLHDVVGTYRYFAVGSWTERMATNISKHIDYNLSLIKMLTALNSDTKNKFSSSINYKIKEYSFSNLLLKGDYKVALKNEFKEIRRKRTKKENFSLFIDAYFSFIKKIYRRLK